MDTDNREAKAWRGVWGWLEEVSGENGGLIMHSTIKIKKSLSEKM